MNLQMVENGCGELYLTSYYYVDISIIT